jgi:SsrA-binding protein
MATATAAKRASSNVPARKLIAQNKKARHDYSIVDVFECGVVLQGTEVKSLRLGRASLVDGFATIDNGEVFLHGVHIPEYEQGSWTNHEPRRIRKLLLHKGEIGAALDLLQRGQGQG